MMGSFPAIDQSEHFVFRGYNLPTKYKLSVFLIVSLIVSVIRGLLCDQTLTFDVKDVLILRHLSGVSSVIKHYPLM